MKPLIGITANLITDGQFGMKANLCGANQSVQALASDYVDAVQKAGGIPIILPILSNMEEETSWLDKLDGILFSGGCDISPLYYETDFNTTIGEVCAQRDMQELLLMKKALSMEGFPILGICRGCQLLNVALGGSLILDIDAVTYGDHFLPKQYMSVPTHKICVKENTLIRQILMEENRVNSYHHQCVDHPGDGVIITAQDHHGMTECIEIPSRNGFTLGVQWHPESLSNNYSCHLNIFKKLIISANENKDRRQQYGSYTGN